MKRPKRSDEFKLAWFLFYGRQLGMSKREILVTPFGEMNDMVSCLAIYNGTAKEKVKSKRTEIFDVLSMR